MMFILFIVLAFVGLMLVIKGPHPIFQDPAPAPAPVAEDSDDVPDLEDPVRKKKRFEKMGAQEFEKKLYGTGIDFTAREKRFILKLFQNCTEYWNRDNCIYMQLEGYDQKGDRRIWWKPRPKDVGAFFEEITGVSRKTANNLEAELEKDDEEHGPKGMFMASTRTGGTREGVKKTALECVFTDLDEFIRDEIVEARKQKYLTVHYLAEKASKYFSSRITPQRMKRALKRLGYEYRKREGKYVNRRHEPKNLFRLKSFCEWVEKNVERDPATGLYKFKIPVGFGDGANEYTKSFRASSWIVRNDPILSTCEKPRKEKDAGQRLNMLGAIYSASYDMDSFTAWNGADVGKNAYAKSRDIINHTEKHVVPNLPRGTGAVYVLDNASNNKKIDEYVKDASADKVHDWIIEHDMDQQRFEDWWKAESPKCTTKKQEKLALLRYIRTNIDEFTELAQILRGNDIQLRYLPAYYPECNPIELIWAHIKREYKSTDAKKPWKQRLEEAMAKVTEKQIEQSFDRSIRYSLDRLQELRQKGEVHNEDEDHVVYDDPDEHDSEDEWLNEQ